MEFTTLTRLSLPLIRLVGLVPWENMVVRHSIPSLRELAPESLKQQRLNPSPSAGSPPSPAEGTPPVLRPGYPPDEQQAAVQKPGCMAADESLLVEGHLRGLAQGRGGFGVLALDIGRLERAALGAERMGDTDLATRLRGFSPRLQEIAATRDAVKAEEAAKQFAPMVEEAWQLGQRCGLSAKMRDKVMELATKVTSGDITRETAVAELRTEAATMGRQGLEAAQTSG